MSMWQINPDLREELDFQLETVRELRKKHNIPDDVYEVWSTKLLYLLSKMVRFEEYPMDAFLAARLVTDEMAPFFEDLNTKIGELENVKNITGKINEKD